MLMWIWTWLRFRARIRIRIQLAIAVSIVLTATRFTPCSAEIASLATAARSTTASVNQSTNAESINQRWAPSGGRSRPISDEQRLLRYLMKDYEKAVRPVYNASDVVIVKLGVTLSQIADLDERNQVLSSIIWLDQEWLDQKMTWDPKEFGGLTKLRVPCNMIWLPDIVLYNSVDDHTKGYMQSLSMIANNGEVFWPPIVKMRSSCKIDIRWFPFDAQVCSLKLGSWAYDGYQLDVTNRSSFVDTRNSIENGEWDIIATKVVRNVKRYPCCVEPFPDVTFYLHLQRRHLYYTMNIIIPCMMMSFLTMTTFALPAESGEKITLGLTVMLSFSVFMLLIAETMPPTAENAPLAGVYLTVIMGMSAASIVLSVLVLNIFVRGKDVVRPPRTLKKFCYYLAKGMCYKIQGSFDCDSPSPHDAEDLAVINDPNSNSNSNANHASLANTYYSNPAQTQHAAHGRVCPCTNCSDFSSLNRNGRRTFTNGYVSIESEESHADGAVRAHKPEATGKKQRPRVISDSNLSLEKSESPETMPAFQIPRNKRNNIDTTPSASVARRLAAQMQSRNQCQVSPVRNSGMLFQLAELLRVSNYSRKHSNVYKGNLLDMQPTSTRLHMYLGENKDNKGIEVIDLQSAPTPQSTSQPSTSTAREQSVRCQALETCRDEFERCLSVAVEQQSYLEMREQATYEWQQISVIFDRFFLITSIAANLFVSLLMLVIFPMIRTLDTALLTNVLDHDRLALAANNEEAARILTNAG